MTTWPTRFAPIILCFAPLFRQRSWRHAERLLLGAILAPGARTVASVLLVLGRAHEPHFVNFHRVLSRAVWSPRRGARILLGLLVRTFVPDGLLVFGIDDTIERRRGRKIRAKDIYRDPVRSSDAHFVKASGLRWLSVMLLAPIPWAHRTWALPVMTALAPSERYHRERGRPHKPLTAFARELLVQLRRWLPGRDLIVVADASFAVLELLTHLARSMTLITRLRLDACLFAPPPPRRAGQGGRPRKKGAPLPKLGERLGDAATRWQRVRIPNWYGETARMIELASGTGLWYCRGCLLPLRWVLVRDPSSRFDPQALLSTDLSLEPAAIVRDFVRRWQLEVTFEEARRHLGLETQRQWSDAAVARTTPLLLSLFSIVTLLAHTLARKNALPVRTAAWYAKARPTFSDALAQVRAHLWRGRFARSITHLDPRKSQRQMLRALTDAVCHAA